MNKPTYISLFSGIGGFDKGLDDAGWRCLAQCEIEKFPRRVLERYWPDVPKYGDIREVNPDELPRADLVCGGSPCQDLSVAGKRAGLAGERSGLFFEFIRIADAVAPKWLLFENVPGLFSSNQGEDFAVVLGEITGFRPAVPADRWRNSGVCVGPKRGAAWRVLDAQYFGVAQRRRRVFIVASPGDGRRAAEVLFEPESLPWNPPPRREAGQVSASLLASGAGTDRPAGIGSEANFLVVGAIDVRHAADVREISGTLQAKKTDGWSLNYQNPVLVGYVPDVVPQAMSSKWAKGTSGPAGDEIANLVAFQQNQRDEIRFVAGDGSVAGALASEPGMKQQNYIAYTLTDNYGKQGGPPNLVYGFHDEMTPKFAENVSPTLTGVSPSGGGHPFGVSYGMHVRRLTPRECERLQGFPDDWTLLDGAADGPRYRALGNAVCRNVAEWLGRRIGDHCGNTHHNA